MSRNLTQRQKITLCKSLISLADENQHIPLAVDEIHAKLEEACGRSLSKSTVTSYLRDGEFTYKRHRSSTDSTLDRAKYIAQAVRQLMEAVGYPDTSHDARRLYEGIKQISICKRPAEFEEECAEQKTGRLFTQTDSH